MSKQNIIIYTTGGFCDVMACSALFTNGDLTDDCNLIFVVNSVDRNVSFLEKTKANIKRLTDNDNVKIENVYDYCHDDDIKTLDSDLIKSSFKDVSKVYLYAESSGLRIDAFFRAFKDAEYIVYEEGMLGYCADIFHNSELGGLKLISKYYSTRYFDKLSPQSLRQVPFNVCSYDRQAIKLAFSKIDDVSPGSINQQDNISVMVVSAPLWRMGPLSYSDVLVEHLNVITSLLSTGATVYFKDHPRPEAKLYSQIRSLLDDNDRENFIDVSDVAMLAETIVDVLSPDAVVGFGSTVLFNSPHFYGVPAFRTSTEFVAYSLGARRQHVLNCALKCQYLPHIDELLEVLHTDCDNKKDMVKHTFDQFIEQTEESLDNQAINNVYEGMFVKNIPVSNDLKLIRNILYKGELPTAKASFLSQLYRTGYLRKLKIQLENIFQVKIMKQDTFKDIKKKLDSNDKTIEHLINVISKSD
ncbi:hypothetical protein BIT28_18880 [Photobacterium proteolyticum]|uniref:Uncharacterized protein n=1 Tax=Photobacterium proteolyticum TaxID=1903952 RepID=A0A1Q9GN53_9GAMM|nr:polysialyltransferase family glycosyltransferase [Photobacterium proteolyticum]OLQ76083.1 hypothetical protein BIT28_18880 [Photobacterium proteolyticum]